MPTAHPIAWQQVSLFTTQQVLWVAAAFGAGTLFCLGKMIQIGTTGKRQLRDWHITPGHITVSEVEVTVSRGEHDTASYFYTPKIHYEYTVGAGQFSGEYTLTLGSTQQQAERLVAHYPVGKRVPVFYHPTRPQESTLDPGTDWSAVFVWGFLALVLGIFGLVAVVLSGI